jgi:tetratricopeptide (TPR) repeat protein
MRPVTRRGALWLAAAAAVLVYAGALTNRWALDDHPVIDSNPAAHAIPAALHAAFDPYWPPSAGVEAGLYRPLTVLTYAIDWTVSNGTPAWFHLVNMLLHGVATALVVIVLLRWFSPGAALVAGFVFALHPVHVEAVANVVGRAEILATIGLLAAVLGARRYRAAPPERRQRWLWVTLAALLFAVLSKESGVVAIALIALDEWIETASFPVITERLYVATAGVTLGWLFLWRAIAGPYVATSVAANFRELDHLQRIWTMLPVQLDVMRLLTMPFDLSAEYNPQMVPQYRHLSLLGVLGAGLSASVLLVGFTRIRRAPALAFGILAAAISYLPTSNLLVPSGVALAERALYFAAIAPAAVVATLWSLAPAPQRRAAILAISALLGIYVVRSVTRVPFWADSRTVIIDDLVQHPDNFRAHARVARILELRGDTTEALSEYLAAEQIFPLDPFVAPYSIPLELSLDRLGLARADAHRADSLESRNPAIARLPIDVELAKGNLDSALVYAARATERVPDSPLLASLYVVALRRTHAPRWRELAALARVGALEARFVATGPLLDSLAAAVPTARRDPAFCFEVRRTLRYITYVRPEILPAFAAVRDSMERPCVPASDRRK